MTAIFPSPAKGVGEVRTGGKGEFETVGSPDPRNVRTLTFKSESGGSRDTMSDTWAATDALGRRVSTFETVGNRRKDRYVAMFYFLWHNLDWGTPPVDNSKVLAQDPSAMANPKSPLWGPQNSPHHWGEPLFGYYLSDDEYVLRKHAQMLSDAGVDVVIFDVTNQLTYPHSYKTLLDVFAKVRAMGGQTPQIAFLCPFGSPANVVRELYSDLYHAKIHPELWFRWKGRPLILADPERLGDRSDEVALVDLVRASTNHRLGESFSIPRPAESVGLRITTFDTLHSSVTLSLLRFDHGRTELVLKQKSGVLRDGAWISMKFPHPISAGEYRLELSEPHGLVAWWTDTGPRRFSGRATVDGETLAKNRALDVTMVSEFGDAITPQFTFRKPQPDYFQGPTQPDMWSWLETYPQHVFRSASGRKEQMSVGVAQNAVEGRLGSMSEPGSQGRSWHSAIAPFTSGPSMFGLNFQEQANRALKEDPELVFVTGWNEWIAGRFSEFNGVKQPVMFVDEFDAEHSRDIEPMRGGHSDDYYYQFVDFVRRYKGARPAPNSGPPRTIDIGGSFDQWSQVQLSYLDDIGDVSARDHDGWNRSIRYVNQSGRNDIVMTKVARDAKNLYFYVRTREPISPAVGTNWMNLFISTDRASGANWEGFPFVVNRQVLSSNETLLERSRGGWRWQSVGNLAYRVAGNEMQVAVPRQMLGISDDAKGFEVDFKWMDGMQKPGDAMAFITDGDAAPNGRFSYRYIVRH